jgi:hypothetical protein
VVALVKISTKVAQSTSRRSEKAWRALTLKGIEQLELERNPEHAETAVREILDNFRLLVKDNAIQNLERDLLSLFHRATTLWKTTQHDFDQVQIDWTADPDDVPGWESIHPDKPPNQTANSIPPVSPSLLTRSPSSRSALVVTPKIHILSPSGETVVLSKGKAIFPNSALFYQAEREEKELAIQMLQAQLSDLDNGVMDSTGTEVGHGLGIMK